MARVGSLVQGWLDAAFDKPDSDGFYTLKDVTRLRQAWFDRNRSYFAGVRPHDDIINTWQPPDFRSTSNGETISYKLRMRDPAYYTVVSGRSEEYFVKATEVAVALVPEWLKTLFAEKSTYLVLGKTAADIDPAFNAVHETALGVYHPRKSAAHVPLTYLSSEWDSYVRQGFQSLVRTILHEFGHSFEDIVMRGGMAHEKDFIMAWRMDAAELGQHEASAGRTYLPQKDGGLQEDEWQAISETFAELFSEILSGDEPILQEAFPRASGIMLKIMASLELRVEQTPQFNEIELPCHIPEHELSHYAYHF